MSDTVPRPGTVAEEVLEFDTPENVVFGYLVAGIGSRFLAATVDTIFIVILQLVVYLTLIFMAASIATASLRELAENDNVSLLAALFGLVAFAFLWGYYIFFELLWNGQSPGKRWAGLRVIRQDGTPIDAASALIRNLVRIVDFLPFYYGIGVVSMFLDRKSRRLGDFAAGTLVVYDRGAVSLEELARDEAQLDRSLSTMPVSAAPFRTALPLHHLQPQHVTLAQSYLSRRHELHNRGQLAVHLAQTLLAALDLPPQTLDEEQAIFLLKQIAGRTDAPGEGSQVNASSQSFG